MTSEFIMLVRLLRIGLVMWIGRLPLKCETWLLQKKLRLPGTRNVHRVVPSLFLDADVTKLPWAQCHSGNGTEDPEESNKQHHGPVRLEGQLSDGKRKTAWQGKYMTTNGDSRASIITSIHDSGTTPGLVKRIITATPVIIAGFG